MATRSFSHFEFPPELDPVLRPEFTLLTRPDCDLCAEMRAALHRHAGGRPYLCHIQDVDDDSDTRAQWGLRIPVLLSGARLVCAIQFDPARAEAEFVPG